MKKQLQKKHKVMLGVGSGVLAATAVATPLAITLTKKETINPFDFDKQYGIDVVTYNLMKEDLHNTYLASLNAQHLTQDVIDKKMADLSATLLTFDQQVSRLSQNNADGGIYTAITSVLKNYAKVECGVDLVRKSRASWNEVENMYNGIKSSFITYMDAHFFDNNKKQQVLAHAQKTYDDIMNDVRTKYANDILTGVMKAKTQLISCFDSINTEIARLAAFTRLNEFMSNYSFVFRENAKSYPGIIDQNDNRFDVLTNDILQEGTIISSDIMNKVFICYNIETRQEVPFDTNMLPGYKLMPIYRGKQTNGETNQHSILIDWSAISSNYATTNNTEAATAHLIDGNENFINDAISNINNIQSIDDMFEMFKDNIKLTSYEMLASNIYETQQLNATYFNKTKRGHNISLLWKSDACYDGFMYANQTSTEEQTISLRQLSRTNVYITDGINETLLKDAFKLVDQENYEPKNLIEKFIKYCDVNDTIKITQNTDGSTNVTNSFTAYYKNQINWDHIYQKNIGSFTFATGVPANKLDISNEFFNEVNNAYNLSHKHSYVFIDRKYQSLYNASQACAVSINIMLTSDILMTVTSIFKAISSHIQHRHDRAFLWWIATALLCSADIIAGKLDDKFQKNFTNPVEHYAKKADDFNDAGYTNSVKAKLKSDFDKFVLADKDGKFNPEQMETKLKEFRKLTKEQQKELFDTYYNFETGFANEFFKSAFELGIDPEKFNKEFAGWKNQGENLLLSIVLLAACTGVFFVIKYMAKITDTLPSDYGLHLKEMAEIGFEYAEYTNEAGWVVEAEVIFF